MRFERLVLENIRSYTREEILFPDGHVLLMGDIGSGKTTILLALEFALFGVMKGFVTGSTLLRHGQTEGSVLLSLTVQKKKVEIKRALKRVKAGVIQDSGYISIDGDRYEGTATELKARMLDILGYPKEFLTKSKSMIFRYTVFTPQEEMKAILYEDPQYRLDVLRKVFGIDKYKRILIHIDIVLRDIRGTKREYTGMIADLDDKKKKANELTEAVSLYRKKLEELSVPYRKAIEDVVTHKKLMVESEEKIILLNQYAREAAVLSARLQDILSNRKKYQEESEKLTEEIAAQEKELQKPEDLSVLKKQIAEEEKNIREIDTKIVSFNQVIGKNKSLSAQAHELIKKITKHDTCPFCYQDITESHKRRIEEEQNTSIVAFNQEEKTALMQIEQLAKDKKISEEKIKELQEHIKKQEMILYKRKVFEEKKSNYNTVSEMIAQTKQSVKEINAKNLELHKKREPLKGIEKEYAALKEKYDLLLSHERKLQVEVSGIERELKLQENHLKELSLEIHKKEAVRKKILSLSDTEVFLEKQFKQMVTEMEKKVMSKVYHGFNDLFSRWFSILMEDEELSVRLDDSFTPIITQNGYETDVHNLSGGEKTSCALSYRLALNKVINDIISTIQTKDVIILDEPTDGFSNQQLERIRDVIEQLYIPQIILVSHENKIEGFVDHIIKVEKDGHESSISVS
jgi:DNA repair protein SbcC/Rad50